MDIFVVILAWQIADLQVVSTGVPLSADSQHVGSTATGCKLSRPSISFPYCIFISM